MYILTKSRSGQIIECTFYVPGRINFHTTLKGGPAMYLEFKGLVGGGVSAVLKQRQGAPPTTQLSYLTSFLYYGTQSMFRCNRIQYAVCILASLLNVIPSSNSNSEGNSRKLVNFQ